MEAQRFRDFDEALKSLEPIEFTINGAHYRLVDGDGKAKDPPAAAILSMFEEGIDPDDMNPADLLKQLVGEENYKLLMTRNGGLSLTQLSALSQWIAEECGYADAFAKAKDENGATNGSGASGPSRSTP